MKSKIEQKVCILFAARFQAGRVLIVCLALMGSGFISAPTAPAQTLVKLDAGGDALDPLPKAPMFPRKGIWIPNQPKHKNPFDAKVTLVYFWDYATVNVIRELSYLRQWHEVYGPHGFQIILVHAPEFQFGYDKENVARAVDRMKLPYFVFLDNDAKLWEAYQNRSWPTKHLIDSDGKIFHTEVGEGHYTAMESKIRRLIQQMNPAAVLPESIVHDERDMFNVWECGEMTTELYVGYKRASWWGVEIANQSGIAPDQTVQYQDLGRRLERGFFLEGQWANREEYFEHVGTAEGWSSYLGIIYLGAEVYAVLDQLTPGQKSRVYVERDGAPIPAAQRGADIEEDEIGRTFVTVGDPRLYYLVSNEKEGYHELKLRTEDNGFAVYVFSFSNVCLSEFDHL